MRKHTLIMLCVLVLCLFAATPGGTAESLTNPQIPNPFTECETIETAKEITGFSITLPEEIPASTDTMVIRATSDGLLEIIYSGTEQQVRIRKARGCEDISGDYNEYENTQLIQLGKLTVTAKSNDNLILTATWQINGYSYSIGAEIGLEKEELLALIEAIQ